MGILQVLRFEFQKFRILENFKLSQMLMTILLGCDNTMLYLSDLVPFHSGQDTNFYFNTCPGTSKNKFTILYFIFGNCYQLTCCVVNSVDSDQLASTGAS